MLNNVKTTYKKARLDEKSISNWGETIHIPDNVEGIQSFSLFTSNNFIKSLTIPTTVKWINSLSFYEIETLQTITIPSTVKYIGDLSLTRCGSLTSIQTDFKYFTFTISYNASLLLKKQGIQCSNIKYEWSMINNLVKSKIRLGSTEINENDIPPEVNNFGPYLFYDQTSITSLLLPNIIYIGDNCFRNCKSLTNVQFSSTLNTIEENCFSLCTSLSTIKIPTTITKLSNSLFSNCINLTCIDLPNTIILFGNNSFYNCRKLRTITIPTSLLFIGDNCFRCCTTLAKLSYQEYSNDKQIECFKYDKQNIHDKKIKGVVPYWLYLILETFNIHCESVLFSNIDVIQQMTIHFNSFNKENKQIIFNIPKVCSMIDPDTFSCTKSIEKILLNSSLHILQPASFSQCLGLKEITIPSTISTLPNACFNKCSSLSLITIPTSITLIGSNCFKECVALQSVDLHSNLLTIGDSAFESCISLHSIKLPDSLKIISCGCFKNCSALTSVCIHSNIQSICNNSFDKCIQLDSIYIPNTFQFTTSVPYYIALCLQRNGIHCTNVKFTKYDRMRWKIEHPNDFNHKNQLKTISIPSIVTTIYKYCFQNCGSLSSITIPPSVTSLQKHCFINCNKLKKYNHFQKNVGNY